MSIMNLDPMTLAAIVLMLAGCALAILEVFVPSGGILGFLACTAVLTSVVLAFMGHGPAVGFVFALTAVIALPACLVLAFKYWPQTSMGRRFLLGLPTEEEVMPEDDRTYVLKQLVGKIGTAKSPMLPSGSVQVEGRTIDAVSQGVAIEKGQLVKVIEVTGNRVMVRPVEEGDQISAENPDELLSQPIDKLGLDSLDEPLS